MYNLFVIKVIPSNCFKEAWLFQHKRKNSAPPPFIFLNRIQINCQYSKIKNVNNFS